MKKNKWLYLEVLIIIVLGIVAFMYVNRKISEKKYMDSQNEVREMLTIDKNNTDENRIKNKSDSKTNVDKTDVSKVDGNDELEYIEKLKLLRKKYPNIVSIIEIPNTSILYVVLQGDNNEFYLNHDKSGKYNPFGEVFLDSRNSSNFEDDNSILYGHNVKSSKTIFNELMNYRNKDFFKNHQDINIYTLEGLRSYKIQSIFIADPNENYRITNFKSKYELENFIDKYKEVSIVNGEEVSPKNRMLTLSTCFNNKERFVIQAIEK